MRQVIFVLLFVLVPFAGNAFKLPDYYGFGSDTTSVAAVRHQNSLHCEPQIVLQFLETNVSYLYWAGNKILVHNNYRIAQNQNANITMKAGQTIVLKPKTAILKGNHYLARIERCEASPCPGAANCVVPAGISPNGDSYNNTFDLTKLCVEELRIFNRYGKEVFKALNYKNEWYGQSGNGELPTGTYFYTITLSTNENVTGWLYLQR